MEKGGVVSNSYVNCALQTGKDWVAWKEPATEFVYMQVPLTVTQPGMFYFQARDWFSGTAGAAKSDIAWQGIGFESDKTDKTPIIPAVEYDKSTGYMTYGGYYFGNETNFNVTVWVRGIE